jgi:hypothetical protein
MSLLISIYLINEVKAKYISVNIEQMSDIKVLFLEIKWILEQRNQK